MTFPVHLLIQKGLLQPQQTGSVQVVQLPHVLVNTIYGIPTVFQCICIYDG